MVVSCCLAPGQHTTKRRKFAKYLPILKDFTDTQQRINLHPCRPIAPTNIREEHWVQCKDVCIRLQIPNFQPTDKRPKSFWTNGLWMLRIRKPAERAPMLNKVLLYLIVMCLQFFTILPGWPPDPLCAKFAIESRSAWHSTEYTYRVKWRNRIYGHDIWSPFCGYNMMRWVKWRRFIVQIKLNQLV